MCSARIQVHDTNTPRQEMFHETMVLINRTLE
jgi:hypothetical protein